MNTPMNPKMPIASFALIALFLSACGGSKTGAAGLEGASACNAMSAKPGETVTCSAPGFEDGCTLFVGNTPVDAVLTEEGQVGFDVPKAPAGFADIVYGCGADTPETIQKNFQILPYFNNEGGDGDGDSGDEILPEEPGAPMPEDPENENPPTPGKDLVFGGELAGAGGSGATVSLEGTDDVHETHLKMVRVHWKIAGDVQEAYIHAPFNRKALDGNEDAPCGAIDGRFLAVNDDGNDFNEGSADAEANAGYFTGERCKNNADCAGLSGGSTPAADMGLKADVAPQKPQRMPLPKAPVCRIDLKKNFVDKGVTEGVFHTLSHQKELRIVLVAKTEDGTVIKDERTWTAPKPMFQNADVSMRPSQGRVQIAVDYEFSVNRPTLNGCADRQVLRDEQTKDGKGTYEATCRVSRGDSKIKVYLYGVGYGNYVKREYRVEVSGGGVVLKDAGDYACDQAVLTFSQCSGSLSLSARTEPATYTIKRNGEVLDQGEMSLAGKVVLKERKSSVNGSGELSKSWQKIAEAVIPAGENSVTFENVRRDHERFAWKAEMGSGDAKTASPALSLPYGNAVLEVLGKSGTKIDITTMNLASLEYHCSGYKGDRSWGDGGLITVSAYGRTTTEFSVWVKYEDPEQVSCEFEAVTLEGTPLTASWKLN